MIDLTITYNRLDAEISRFAESLTLTERIGKAAGTLDITLCNTDGRFTRDWAATKGDSLSVKLGDVPAEPYSIESVAVSSSPRTVTWQCKARPATTKAPSGRGSGSPPPKSGAIIDTRASWPSIASITLSGLLSKVCSECGLKAQYCPKKDVKLKNVVRYNESGWHLLERYAKKSGYSLRATATKVSIIAPKQSGNSGAPQVTVDITSSSIESLGNVDGLKPAKVQSRSYDPRSAEVVTSSAGDGDGSDIGVDFTLDDAVGLYEDIALSQGVHTLTVVPDSRYVAGAILGVVGASRMQITQMTYTRSADGETMQVEARAI